MKRLLLIILTIFSFAHLSAQSYLQDGDVVSISFVANDVRYYLEASGNGITTQPYATDDCLWQLGVNNGNYTFQDLTTGRYLSCNFTDPSNSQLMLASTQPTAFLFNHQNSVEGSYMQGHLYFSIYYEPWWTTISMYIDGEWGASGPYFITHSWTNMSLDIEKWEQKGAGDPTLHFNPSKIEFSYAKDDAEALAQARDVTLMIEATTESYYQCVARPDEALLRRSTGNVDESAVSIKNIYWESNKGKASYLDVSKYAAHQDENRTLMTLSDPIGGQEGQWQFTITPNGKSPMGLKDYFNTLERWIDYADNVVVEYTYGNSNQLRTQEMRVVRKSYHQEELPTITFSINPVTYTFSKEEETKEFSVTLTHQHGSVIYNVDNQAIQTEYTYEPVQVRLQDFESHFDPAVDKWEKTYEFLHQGSTPWLRLNEEQFAKGHIYITATANTSGSKRSDTIVVTLDKTAGDHQHRNSFMIPIHQRGMEGGIQFKTNNGQSGDALVNGRQQVHTAERNIYYLPNQEIELRLPESGFSGYMRWYDYDTNGDPYYNYAHDDKDSTSWILSPRAADGSPFAAINTPQSSSTISTEGYSYGLYAINKDKDGNASNGTDAAIGGILDEGNPYNPMPIIKGWNYDQNNPATAYHTMACDVSAYTDYQVWTNPANRTRIDSIQEPTLSYRQLFHLKPASEMADTLAARSARGEYLENYFYQAPAGKQILLSTEYRHTKVRSHASELCYFYKDNTGNIHRIDNRNNANILKWYVSDADGSNKEEYTPQYSAEMDYLIVRNETYEYERPKVYTLELPATSEHAQMLIARFEVEYVDIERQGPTNKTIITLQRINTQYKKLAEINFDNTHDHLPWEQASYGYVYTSGQLATYFKRGADQGAFPFYGEYIVTEGVDEDWAREAAHGGQGQSLYVDGTMEPGLVASISTKATICSGQTMYCSAWFCNPAPSGWSGEGNPIFRCNIQGRRAGEKEWEDAGVYFVGELLKGSKWQQIVFPIKSASNYAETRVSIYNFATTNQGNDFMVDDITLFVSQLPITAYKGEMACRSVSNGETSAVAVLRLDYSNINAGSDGYMYYQIFNETYTRNDTTGFPVSLTGDAAYYHDYDEAHQVQDHDHPYGSVNIPQVGFDPEVYNDTTSGDKLLIYTSVSAMLDDMIANNRNHGKAYIRTENSGVIKWLLYVAHVIVNTTEENQALTKLYDGHNYVMRMAYTPKELPTAECNLITPLHATQQTVFKLRDSGKTTIMHNIQMEADTEGDEEYISSKSIRNCPNERYSLTATVVNHLAINGAGGNTEDIAAPIFSDWLIGDPAGDVLSEKAPERAEHDSDVDYQNALNDYNERLQASVRGFKEMYGYTHDEVTSAIMYDMRRYVTSDKSSPDYNPNHRAKSFAELQSSAFLSAENYEIIKHLCEHGWLQLYDTTVQFYLGSRPVGNTYVGDTVRYWCFPIAETAVTTIKVGGKDTTLTLKDCNEPHRVFVASVGSEHYLNIAPIAYADKTAQQSVQVPTIKVLEGSTSVTIPITELGASVTVDGANANKDSITLQLAELTYIHSQTGELYDEQPELVVGEEYTVRLTMKNELTGSTESNEGCNYGYAFVQLQIVPRTMIWQPSGHEFNGWGLNENWKGLVMNGEGVVTDTIPGFVPTSEVNVIIPELANSLLYPYIVPEEDHNHYEMTIGFEPHHCNQIYFAPNAHIHNQHLLQYKQAFVDMQVAAGAWNMVAAPLKNMVSGDMYIPHTGWWNNHTDEETSAPFEVSGFVGQRHTDAAYAFWQGFYNTTTDIRYEGTGIETASSADFVYSNALNQPLTVGSGYQIYGLGPGNNGNTGTLTIRLPKPDTQYYYYTPEGVQSGKSDPVPTTDRNQLAFTPVEGVMDIELTNVEQSSSFLFGNPTMAYIDMKAFLEDANNATVLNPVFHRVENSTWRSTTEFTLKDDRYLAPMTSVMLETYDKVARSEITVKLKPEHLTLNNNVYTREVSNEGAKALAARHQADDSSEATEMMTIYAYTNNAHARTTLAVNSDANDYYQVGEDALFVSTGIASKSDVVLPLSMYTVAEQVPMMTDVRQGISTIPLAVLAAEGYATQHMQLAFYFTPNWTRTCYLCDKQTGQKIRIMNGLIITVEMPDNHDQRYYIEGEDEYIGSGGDGVATSISNMLEGNKKTELVAYSVREGELVVTSNQLIKQVKIYDLTGKEISEKSLGLLQTSTSIAAPAGMCIVEAKLQNGKSQYTQALVK